MSERTQKVAGRLVSAVDGALSALEELREAREELAREARRPPLKVAGSDEGERQREES
jgi:hypothetical protein